MAVALFVVREVPRSRLDVTNRDGKPLRRFRPIAFCPSLADKHYGRGNGRTFGGRFYILNWHTSI